MIKVEQTTVYPSIVAQADHDESSKVSIDPARRLHPPSFLSYCKIYMDPARI